MGGAQTLVLLLAARVLAQTEAMNLTNCSQLHIPSVLAGRSAVTVDTYVLFAVNSHDDDPNAGLVNIFNSTDKSWFKTSMSGGRTNIAATTWQHLAIFAGGTINRGKPKSNAVDVWDSHTAQWSRYNMTIGRDLLGCGSVGDYTIFAGGSAPQVNQSETAEVDIWNHRTGKWSTAKLSQPRKKPVAVAAGDKLIIAGGEIAKPASGSVGLGGYSSVVDIFHSNDETWSTATLSQPRQYFGACSALPTQAVFGGGFANFDQGLLGEGYRSNVVDIYDSATDKWSTAKLSYNRSNLAAANIANRYCAFGSGNIDSTSKLTYDFFDGKTGEWSASHGHLPGNPGVAGLQNIALFANGDGSVDAIAIDGDCSAVEK